MSDHAAYMRNWRRLHGMVKGRAHDPLPSEAELERRGQELAAMMMAPVKDLPWPKDLFSRAEEVPKMGRFIDHAAKCHCQCGQDHKNRVSGTKPSDHGHGFNVYWFAGESHKNKWIKDGRP